MAEEVARELANPSNALGKLTLILDYVHYDGDLPGASSQDSTVLLFQPSLPYPLEHGMVFLARPAIPKVSRLIWRQRSLSALALLFHT